MDGVSEDMFSPSRATGDARSKKFAQGVSTGTKRRPQSDPNNSSFSGPAPSPVHCWQSRLATARLSRTARRQHRKSTLRGRFVLPQQSSPASVPSSGPASRPARVSEWVWSPASKEQRVAAGGPLQPRIETHHRSPLHQRLTPSRCQGPGQRALAFTGGMT